MMGVPANVLSGYQRKSSKISPSPRSLRLSSQNSSQSFSSFSTINLSRGSNDMRFLAAQGEVPSGSTTLRDSSFSDGKGAINVTYKVFREISKDMTLRKIKGETVGFVPSSKVTTQVDYVFHLIEVPARCFKLCKRFGCTSIRMDPIAVL